MKIFEFEPVPLSVTGSEAFTEASAEELRVLLALIERGYRENDESLARLAHVTKARCSAAVTFWQEAGVLQPRRADTENIVKDVHAYRPGEERIEEERGEEIAREIREKQLRSLLDECAALMGKTELSSADVRQITALSSQYGLGEEYIATLAAHIAEHGKLTAAQLVRRAATLSERGITKAEDLSAYLAESEKQSGELWEIRRILGVYGRPLSKTEEEHFLRWTHDFGYGGEIVGEAYDITVTNTGRASIAYMNKLLSAWHAAGCTTVEQVRALREKEKAEKAANDERQAQQNAARPRKPAKEKPRYGNFDPEEAMRRAIERSFAELDETDEKNK